jgi:streptogramin lyase
MSRERSTGPSRTSVAPVAMLVALIMLSSFTYFPTLRVVQGSISPTQVVPIQSLTLTEWDVPTTGAGPSGMGIDSSGNIWITENSTSKIARFDPANDNFTEWNIPTSNSEPRNIFVSQVSVSGTSVTQVFFTEYGSDKIARFDSSSNNFTEWQLDAGSKPVGIYVDENSDIWFTESGRDIIGRLTPSTNNLTEWILPGATSVPGAPVLKPWGIYVQTVPRTGYTNRFVWFTETANNTIGRLEANSHRLTYWYLSRLLIGSYGPMDITMGTVNGLPVAVFTNIDSNRVSILGNDTGGGSLYRESVIPTGSAKPSGVVFDSSRSAFWFAENNAGKIANVNSTSTFIGQLLSATYCSITPTTGSPECDLPANMVSHIASVSGEQHVSGTFQIQNSALTSTIGINQGPSSGVTEYLLPNASSGPTSLSLGPGGDVWFTLSSSSRMGRLSTPYVFQVSASPNTRSVTQGQNATFTVQTDLISGSPLPVQLTLLNAPSNVGVQFNPQSVNPSFNSTLTIVTTTSTPTGTFNMSIQAASGGQNQFSSIILNVQLYQPPPPPPPAPFNYTVTITSTQTATITQGQSASFDVAVTLTGGTPQTVNLTATELPADTNYLFTVTSGLPSFTSTLQVQTNLNTPPGSYPITISAVFPGSEPHHPAQEPLLVITELPRDFTLTTPATDVMLTQGSRSDIPLTITSTGPFNSNVELAGTFDPTAPEITVTFSPSSVIPQPDGGTVQTTMEIVAQMNAAGTYLLTVTATSTNPTRNHQIMISVQVSPCLIATATFGSELAPEVQFLRHFRDQQITHTFAGSNFMSVFNTVYYSFSPAVAQYEYSHATLRGAVRVLLYPLMGVLHLASSSYTVVEFQPELAALTAGLVAGSLIGLVYLTLPAFSVLWLSRKRIDARTKRRAASLIMTSLAALIIGFIVSEAFALPVLMMLVSSALVLTAVSAGSILPALEIVERFRRRA